MIGLIGEIMIKKKCCLCGNSYIGYGNNAQPLKEGYCCDPCNTTKVIPARLKRLNHETN